MGIYNADRMAYCQCNNIFCWHVAIRHIIRLHFNRITFHIIRWFRSYSSREDRSPAAACIKNIRIGGVSFAI